MKFLKTLLLFTAIAVTTGCSTPAIVDKKTTGATDATFEARAALSTEQQRTFDKLYLEAVCQKLKGNNDAAFELLSAALNINPQAAEALFTLGYLQLSTVRPSSLMTANDSILIAKGEEMLKKAYELEPSNPYYRSTLADYYINTGDYLQAAELYKIIQDEKPSQQNLMLLSRLYMATMQPEAALDALRKMEEAEGLTEEIAQEQFHMLEAVGREKEAIDVMNRLISENPNDPKPKALLAICYMEIGKQDEARVIFEKLLAEKPTDIEARANMLRYYQTVGDTRHFNEGMSDTMLDPDIDNTTKLSLLKAYAVDIARGNSNIDSNTFFDHYLEALSLPQYDADLALFAMAFAEVAKIDDRTKLTPVLKTIVEFDPTNVMARYKLLQYYASSQDIQSLISLCMESIRYVPDDPIFYYYGGIALFQEDRTDEAVDVLGKGTKVIDENTDPDVASDIFATLGDIYHEQGKNTKAYEAYDNAVGHNPDNLQCLNNFAYYLSLEGKQLDKALEMSKKTIDAEPNNPTFLDTYAWILFKKKQYTQASIYIDHTINCLPENEREGASAAGLYDHAGDIYFRCGDTEQALEFWKKAQLLSDDSELSTKLNKKINNRRL